MHPDTSAFLDLDRGHVYNGGGKGRLAARPTHVSVGGVCSLISLVPYPKHVRFASLTLLAESWGPGGHMPLNKVVTIT
jgi:hypothetical protein